MVIWSVLIKRFVYLYGVYHPNCEFFTPMETSPLPDQVSALKAIEQEGLFKLPHLLWHGASVYNGYLRGPVTLTPVAEHLTVQLSLPVFTT